MVEWIRKIVALVVIFSLIFIIVYNILYLPDDYIIPEGSVLVHAPNKLYCVTGITTIITSVILEVIQIFSYIENTNSKQTNRVNIIKLLVVTFILLGLGIYSYYIYMFYSVPIMIKA